LRGSLSTLLFNKAVHLSNSFATQYFESHRILINTHTFYYLLLVSLGTLNRFLAESSVLNIESINLWIFSSFDL